MTESWIVVPNWDRFQHYKDRDPPWIKLHRSLASNPDWWALSGHRRAILVGLWLEYATTNRQLPDSTASLTRRIGVRVMRRDINALVDAGFIQISASRPLAPRYQDAMPEAEAEAEAERKKVERKKDRPASNGPPPPAWPCPHCGVMLRGPQAVAEHVENVHYDLEPSNP